VVALAAAGCGGGTSEKTATLEATCVRGRAAVARVGPIRDLGEATTALRSVLRLQRRALADLEAAGTAQRALADRFRAAIETNQRSLQSIVGSDPQQTMTPVRTGVADARRAAGDAKTLVGSLCSGQKD
jgi:hypothetical protein